MKHPKAYLVPAFECFERDLWRVVMFDGRGQFSGAYMTAVPKAKAKAMLKAWRRRIAKLK